MPNRPHYKYPSTPYLPWSPTVNADDTVLDVACLVGKEVVVTEKLDGENTTMARAFIHARSLDSGHHPSRAWVKALHGRIAHQIPEGWRLCGENVYALHSIPYHNLASYFYLFSVWDEHNCCLPWDETVLWAGLLELVTPPLLYRGLWDEARLRALTLDTATCEGYVVRTVAGFAYGDFAHHLAKWVRPSHVQTDQHWMARAVVPNALAEPNPAKEV